MKKVLKILTLIMLIFTILKIADTYAKYYASAHTTTLSKEVGQWVIKVNEMDIYSETGETVEFEVDNFGNFSNPHATPDKISPGSEGYADIIIDPTGTDVAVKYEIVLNVSNLPEGVTVCLEMATGENTLDLTGENKYTGTISLADVQAGNTANIRCYIRWENLEGNNANDTTLGTTLGQELSVTATVTVRQYLGTV